jgi:hypothetical protein
VSGIRSVLDGAFAADTANPGTVPSVPSAGHCAAVAAILYARYGGHLVSANVEGESHWFNRLPTYSGPMDIDLTADQFGRSRVNFSTAKKLYPRSRQRQADDLLPETVSRAQLLAERAGIAFSPAKFPRYQLVS